jgi:hypothetical protein
MNRKAILGLLAAFTLVAAGATIWAARPTEAGPTECPSDVDNDGNVGILDFLQVLADWGPCPSPPQLVSVTLAGIGNGNPAASLLVRTWTDGLAEYTTNLGGPWTPWTPLPESPHAGLARVVDCDSLGLASGLIGECGPGKTLVNAVPFVRLFADGYSELVAASDCSDGKGGFSISWGEWGPVPPPP